MQALLARLMSNAGSPALSPTASCMAFEAPAMAAAGAPQGLHALHTTPRSHAATPLGTPVAASPVAAAPTADASALGGYGSPLPNSPMMFGSGAGMLGSQALSAQQLYSLGSQESTGGCVSGMAASEAPSLFSSGGPAARTGLPGNWARLKDPEGRSFYYNAVTRESAWELPCRC